MKLNIMGSNKMRTFLVALLILLNFTHSFIPQLHTRVQNEKGSYVGYYLRSGTYFPWSLIPRLGIVTCMYEYVLLWCVLMGPLSLYLHHNCESWRHSFIGPANWYFLSLDFNTLIGSYMRRIRKMRGIFVHLYLNEFNNDKLTLVT
jgi:hypothetical protein